MTLDKCYSLFIMKLNRNFAKKLRILNYQQQLKNLKNFEETPLLQLIPKTPQNKHLYQNGASKLIPRLTLKVHSEIEECFYLWEKFSPKKTLFDLWDFCYAWSEGLNSKLYFYTLYEGKKPLGVLPLSYYDGDKRFEWFGCEWLENHSFFVEDENIIDLLLTVAPSPLYLNSIAIQKDIEKLAQYGKLSNDPDERNIKDISNFSSLDELLVTMKKKHRYNLKYDYKRLIKTGVKIEMIKTKDLTLFEEMTEMNKERFDGVEKDESYVDKFKEAFRQIIKKANQYDFKYIKVSSPMKTASIDMVFTYNDIYYPATGSNNIVDFNGIGNFMTYIEFEDAINNRFKLVDILQEDHGWKHRYFDKIPLFVFEK